MTVSGVETKMRQTNSKSVALELDSMNSRRVLWADGHELRRGGYSGAVDQEQHIRARRCHGTTDGRVGHPQGRGSGDLEGERVEELTLIEGMSYRGITDQVAPHDHRWIRGFDGE